MIEKVDINDIPKRKIFLPTKPAVVRDDIYRFLEAGFPAGEIEWRGKYKSATSVATNYRNCAKRNKIPVVVIQRGERVFISRRDEA